MINDYCMRQRRKIVATDSATKIIATRRQHNRIIAAWGSKGTIASRRQRENICCMGSTRIIAARDNTKKKIAV